MTKYKFKAALWLYQGKAAWFFITVPKDVSEQIKFRAAEPRRGWGSVKVAVTIGKTGWKTSIFPQAKAGTYLLPVKADVRKAEKMKAGGSVTVKLTVSD